VTDVVVPETPSRPRPRWGVRAVLLGVVAVLVAMWIYVLFIGKEQSPNHLADETWAPKAEAVCAATPAATGGSGCGVRWASSPP
jgi:hypothetical protein